MNKKIIYTLGISLSLIVLTVLLSSYTGLYDMYIPARRVKNIILLIGDGMGVAQISGTITVSGDQLNMTTVRNIGFSKTQSYDNYTTDSAAGGTAISTGTKTRNGMLGLAPDSSVVSLITELLRDQKKMSFGVVSTSAVTHATPASFVAHNADRNDYEGIALDYVMNKPDVFIGGGKANFDNRKDHRDLIQALRDEGYEVVFNMEELQKANADRVAGLLAEGHMPGFSEGRDYMLAEATQKAIGLLSRNKRGFFLMVEGSQIDWGGHANDATYVLEETFDFDTAVGVALRYAAQDRGTLVIITADHETGGLTIPGGNLKDKSIIARFTTEGHTGVIVPVLAFGPGAEQFTGFYENTGIFDRMKGVLRLK